MKIKKNIISFFLGGRVGGRSAWGGGGGGGGSG